MTSSFRFQEIETRELDFKALKHTAKEDPVGLLNLCRDQHRCICSGTRQLRWELIASIYASAFSFRDDENRFKQLLKHEWFSNRSYEAKQKDALRLALLIGTNAEAEGLNYKKACREAQKLQPFFDDDVSPKEVLAEITKAKGLSRLIRDISVDDSSDVKEGDLDEESHLREITLPGNKPSKKPGVKIYIAPMKIAKRIAMPVQTKSTKSDHAKHFDADHDLVANAGHRLHSLLLTPKETDVWIKIRATNELGEFRRFDIVEVEAPEDPGI